MVSLFLFYDMISKINIFSLTFNISLDKKKHTIFIPEIMVITSFPHKKIVTS